MIRLHQSIESPAGHVLDSVPAIVGVWQTVSTDHGPRAHVGGRGYGWLVQRRDLPEVYGFLKRSWDGRPLANRTVLEKVFRRDGYSTAAVPALLDITDEGDPVFLYFARSGGSIPAPSVTLTQVLARSDRLQPGVVEMLAVCLAATLRFFGHLEDGLTLLHGDLKPSNILVNESAWLFGVVDCEECSFINGSEVLEDHRVVSTPSWRPPEATEENALALLGEIGSVAAGRVLAKTPGWDVWACSRLLAVATVGQEALETLETNSVDGQRSWKIARKCAEKGASAIVCSLVAQGLEVEPTRRMTARDFVQCVAHWQEADSG